MSLLTLPDDALEHILSFLSYDEVAEKRIVSRKFNEVCGYILNRGFHKVEQYHRKILKEFKALLPRRESGRRTHPLARHCDMLVAVETRLSMLSMTFLKHIEMNQCCFIPGKVIDETWNVLRLLTDTATTTCLPRTQEALQELRDLSSMAMEHFDEKIAPALKQRAITQISLYCDSPTSSDIVSPHSQIAELKLHYIKLRRSLTECVRANKLRRSRDVRLQKKLDISVLKMDYLWKVIKRQRKYQNSINANLSARIRQQENEMSELKQRIHEAGHTWKDVFKSNFSAEGVSSSSNNSVAASSSSTSISHSIKRKLIKPEPCSDDILEFFRKKKKKKKTQLNE